MQKQPQENKGPGVALRAAAPSEREELFREVYEAELRGLLQRCGRNPRALQMGTNDKFTNYVRRIVGRGKVVLEIGCGFGSTAIAVGGSANELIGIDTAPGITPLWISCGVRTSTMRTPPSAIRRWASLASTSATRR